MLGKGLSAILKPFISLYGTVMKAAVKVAGANLRRGVVIKNEDSCAFCIRLLLTFLHRRCLYGHPAGWRHELPRWLILYDNCKYKTDALMKRRQGCGCQWRHRRFFHLGTLESVLSPPGAFDLTSGFLQLASPQPPRCTNMASFLNVTCRLLWYTSYNIYTHMFLFRKCWNVISDLEIV